jgi:acyl-CoA synthetase (NDP forming)/GNAT superfamily N-acetyltransferase
MGEDGYPAGWEADVAVSDGGVVHVRPIRPDDRDRLVAFHSRLSERTVYLRYFAPHPVLSDRDLDKLTRVDHRDRVALVALLGDDLIGVGRYDRLAGTRDAEVAFVVDDAQQGRGIGSMLLEHLAAAARERGIERFVAEVLAENSRMVRVFKDAGYTAEYSFDSGVVELSFPIAPTEQSRAVAYERERRAESRSIERLLTPRSVAVIGASTDPGKLGHVVFGNLMAYGFQGPVYPVHPEARHVGGVRAYPSVLDVPDDVDLAVVAVPAAAVAGVVEECARKQVRGLVVLSGGFGERGPAGRELERALVAEARANGMRVVGPNCLGVVNADPEVRLNATIAPLVPGRGRVGFFAQSGALGTAILASAVRWGLGLSSFVSAGNRADVSGNDLLQYWERDPATDVVLLYLESFGNPRKFARLARRVARTKPVVAVKTGRYAATAAVPGLAAHSVPVPEERVQALFEGSGVIRVDTLTQLFDVAQLLAYQPLPTGRRIATVTNSSALGVLVADACVGAGLERAAASADLGPDVDVAGFAAAVRTACDEADAVVAVFAPVLATPGEDFARALAEVGAASRVPVASTFLGVEGVPAALRRVDPDGQVLPGSVPSYPTPERAVRALAAAVRYAEWRRRPAGTVPDLDRVDADAARTLVAAVLADAPGGRELTAAEAARLLAAYGLATVPRRLAAGPAEAVAAAEELGYPVAVKATAEGLRHRPDLGSVRLDLRDAAAVEAAAVTLAELGGGAPVVVQPMARPGVATVVEVLDDPSFGALVSFGVGGIATELLGDRAYAPVPLSDLDAAALVRAPRAAPLLFGHRGAEPVDTAALTDLLLRVSRLAEDLPEVLALELNPILVGRAGLDVLAGRVTVGSPTARADPGPRRL